jgi:ABC-type antimicrobial peptide transport system permease subunit
VRGLAADLTHAFRIYRRTPLASGLAVLVLAVAMAFVTAFLSMYVDVGIKGHPGFEEASELVTIGQTDGRQLGGLPVNIMGQMAEDIRSLDAVAGVIPTTLPAIEEGQRPIQLELVTSEFFPGLKPRLQAGRGLEPADHESEAGNVVVVSYRYWRDVLGGGDVIGTTIHVDFQSALGAARAFIGGAQTGEGEDAAANSEYQVIGIMASEMRGSLAAQADAWLPFERAIQLAMPVSNLPEQARAQLQNQIRTSLTMQTFGRRSRGATVEAVIDEIRTRYADAPDELRLQPGFQLDAVDGVVTSLTAHRSTLRQLKLFLAASVLIALVAAANVSLFLLARAPGRRRELGIRMAVGAPLGRLARQLASEAGVLVLAGAVLGVLLSLWLGTFLRGLAFLRDATWRDVNLLDWRVLVALAVFLLILTVLVARAPNLGLTRLGIAASSRQVAARASLAQRFAGALQISIAGTLGGAAIAFGWYLASLTLTDPGYAIGNRQAVQFTLDLAGALRQASAGASGGANAGANIARLRETLNMNSITVELARRAEAIEAIPGVSAVTFGTPVPGLGNRNTTQIPDPADPSARMQLRTGTIDTRYVDVLGLDLLYGRVMAEGETEAVLVNQAFAQKFFGDDNVVGETARIATRQGQSDPEIVGVLRDLSFDHPAADVEPIVFRLMSNSLNTNAVVETSLSSAALQQELEKISGGGAIEIRVLSVRPLTQLRDTLIAPDRARSWLTIGAATLVVLLAALGFYGTQRYLVTAGRREYAIRASLGAGPKALGRLVLHRGLILGLPGLVLGALLAFIAVAWLRDGFVSRDTSPFAVTLAVIVGLVLLLALASFGPARQARRTQPAPLLREE